MMITIIMKKRELHNSFPFEHVDLRHETCRECKSTTNGCLVTRVSNMSAYCARVQETSSRQQTTQPTQS